GREHALRRRRPSLFRQHDPRHWPPGHRDEPGFRTRDFGAQRRRHGEHSRRAEWAADADACQHNDAPALDRGAVAMTKRSSRSTACVASLGFVALTLSACGGKDSGGGLGTTPPPTLDSQLRATLQQWGAIPIGAVRPPSPALVDLGKALFFDKVLSGNRDVACATRSEERR